MADETILTRALRILHLLSTHENVTVKELYDYFDRKESKQTIQRTLMKIDAANIPLRTGVLFSSKGPSYETPAEVRMIRTLGGDVASMSTAPEIISASALGMEAVAFSCVTNMAPGVVPGRAVNHEEVIEVMESRKGRFSELLARVLERFESDRARGTDGNAGRGAASRRE